MLKWSFVLHFYNKHSTVEVFIKELSSDFMNINSLDCSILFSLRNSNQIWEKGRKTSLCYNWKYPFRIRRNWAEVISSKRNDLKISWSKGTWTTSFDRSRWTPFSEKHFLLRFRFILESSPYHQSDTFVPFDWKLMCILRTNDDLN